MIKTSRLWIRPFQEQDGRALFEYLSNPVIYRYEPGEPVSLEEARALAQERSRHTDFWAVARAEDQKLVGHLYFKQVEPEEYLTWELGYIFNPAYQNKGFATESARGLIEHGFEHWGIHRVIAQCNPENTASWRVLEKIGMKREGHFRKNIFFDSQPDGSPAWIDTYLYAALREDVLRG